VTKAVEAVPAVDRAVVDLDAGEISVEGKADERSVRQAIQNAGYDVRGTAA
jgi:copper chaperone